MSHSTPLSSVTILRPREINEPYGPPGLEHPRSTRRRILSTLGIFCGGLSLPLFAPGLLSRAWRGNGEAKAAEAPPKPVPLLPSWVRELETAPTTRILPLAGEYERRSLRDRVGPAAGPAFERLLALALRSPGPQADPAAACALRCLERLGREDLWTSWILPILEARGFEETRKELKGLLARAHERRKWIHRR